MLLIFLSAYFFPTETTIPTFMSILLLIPIYIWQKNYPNRKKLSKGIIERDKAATLFWIFILFILALSMRIPFALLFGMPYEKAPLIYLLILTIILVEKTDTVAFGFKTKNIGKSLLKGFEFFAVLQGVQLIIFYLLILVFTNQVPVISFNIVLFLSAIPFHTLCVGVSEEGLFRGYMQTHLEKLYTSKEAIPIQAIFFGVWHFVWNLSPFNPIGMLLYVTVTFFIGLFFGYFYSKTRNLSPLIFAHGLYNSVLQGIVESQGTFEVFQTFPVSTQILTWLAPYVLSAIVAFFFIKHFVKEI